MIIKNAGNTGANKSRNIAMSLRISAINLRNTDIIINI